MTFFVSHLEGLGEGLGGGLRGGVGGKTWRGTPKETSEETSNRIWKVRSGSVYSPNLILLNPSPIIFREFPHSPRKIGVQKEDNDI